MCVAQLKKAKRCSDVKNVMDKWERLELPCGRPRERGQREGGREGGALDKELQM